MLIRKPNIVGGVIVERKDEQTTLSRIRQYLGIRICAYPHYWFNSICGYTALHVSLCKFHSWPLGQKIADAKVVGFKTT